MSHPSDPHETSPWNRGAFFSVIVIAVVLVGALAWSVHHTTEARAAWFREMAAFDEHGEEADAVVIGKQCGAKQVKYRWRWQHKDYVDSGWPWNSVCSEMKLGTAVRVRFLPEDLRCAVNSGHRRFKQPARIS